MVDNGHRPKAIGLLSDSGDLKMCWDIFFPSVKKGNQLNILTLALSNEWIVKSDLASMSLLKSMPCDSNNSNWANVQSTGSAGRKINILNYVNSMKINLYSPLSSISEFIIKNKLNICIDIITHH